MCQENLKADLGSLMFQMLPCPLPETRRSVAGKAILVIVAVYFESVNSLQSLACEAVIQEQGTQEPQ